MIVVTGGTGLIGSFLLRELRARQLPVRALYRGEVPPANAPRLAAAPDPRLTEQGRHGLMPRIGEGRLRALDVYARPDEPGTGPRIAILVTGLGIGQSATAAATARLPQAA